MSRWPGGSFHVPREADRGAGRGLIDRCWAPPRSPRAAGPRRRRKPRGPDAGPDELPYVTWIEKSSVAALREGVIETMELQIGMPVKKGGTIGLLHHEFAELTVAKAQLQADSVGPEEKAEAQEERGAVGLRRNKRLNERKPGMVSAEDVAKAEGELKVATAMMQGGRRESGDRQGRAATWPSRPSRSTRSCAPFDGIVIKRMKKPGESVRANEAVVEHRQPQPARPWMPTSPSSTPIASRRTRSSRSSPGSGLPGGEPLPIEQKRFRGKITFVDPEIQPVAENAVRICAEFENPAPYDLKPGLKVQMTIFLTTDAHRRGQPPGDRRPGPHEPSEFAVVSSQWSGERTRSVAADPAVSEVRQDSVVSACDPTLTSNRLTTDYRDPELTDEFRSQPGSHPSLRAGRRAPPGPAPAGPGRPAPVLRGDDALRHQGPAGAEVFPLQDRGILPPPAVRRQADAPGREEGVRAEVPARRRSRSRT